MRETLESALKKLESITDTLEKNELSLEEAMQKYEEGLKLVTFCNKIIKDSEEKIETLSGELNKDLKMLSTNAAEERQE